MKVYCTSGQIYSGKVHNHCPTPWHKWALNCRLTATQHLDSYTASWQLHSILTATQHLDSYTASWQLHSILTATQHLDSYTASWQLHSILTATQHLDSYTASWQLHSILQAWGLIDPALQSSDCVRLAWLSVLGLQWMLQYLWGPGLTVHCSMFTLCSLYLTGQQLQWSCIISIRIPPLFLPGCIKLQGDRQKIRKFLTLLCVHSCHLVYALYYYESKSVA